jgi:hypothetical protein
LSRSQKPKDISAKLILYDMPMQHFSQILENRVIEYFHRKHGIDISPATAQEYLNSFADLFLDMAEIERRKRHGGGTDTSASAR